MAELVESSRDGNVALLRLNRPEARNALSPELMEELASKLERLDPDPEVRCLVIAGSDKVFAAGADIKAMSERSFAEALRHPAASFWRRLAAIRTPLIAAVSGYALGGGCELALACDMIVAAEGATFGQPEINLGIIPGFGGTQRLPRLVGEGRALEMNLTGTPIGGYDACEYGLANDVVPDHELFDTSLRWARKMAQQAPLAIEKVKQVSGQGLDAEAQAFGEVFGSEDAKEGIGAFLGKRTPKFQGK